MEDAPPEVQNEASSAPKTFDMRWIFIEWIL